MFENRARKWNWRTLLAFEGLICSVSLFFSITGSIAPQVVVTIPAGSVSVRSNTVLLLLGSIAPGLVLFVMSRECRSAVFRLKARIGVYIAAVLVGFTLPFLSYFGARHAYPLWDSATVPTLARVFLINLLLSPLWEEVIWRAYLYPVVNSMLQTGQAIVVAAVAWTVWHVGFLYYLYHSGIRPVILAILIVQLLFVGIILCSFFTLSRYALAPCVLLHTALNASTAAYFGRYARVNDIGSYTSETVFTLIVAIIVFRMALRREGNTYWQAEKVAE